jgi:hypothetical protein
MVFRINFFFRKFFSKASVSSTYVRTCVKLVRP